METDYISREAVETFLRSRNYCLDTEADIEYVVECLSKEIPAANVRPVVYCLDCKYCEIRDKYFHACNVFDIWNVPKDHFCSFGKRREGGTP